MSGLLQDVRFALRQLRKSPGFTIAAGLMLALAICANSTAFSWIDGTMLHPIPGAQKTSELVSAIERHSFALDIEVVSSGIEITDHDEWLMRIADGQFDTPVEKGRLVHSLREVATKDADALLR